MTHGVLGVFASLRLCVALFLPQTEALQWRAALKRIARRLEVDAPGAYQFQELYAADATQPVSLSESETYRSHLGRFNIEGVTVEVMGDLHRRAGDRWAPTSASTEDTVDLDGVPVRVSWLEEETLAYLRRGRLERAARCLPHCDRGRLARLLSGEVETNVM